MQISDPVVEAWKAELSLGYERRGEGTVLARREHVGPLRVQKALHPEGPGVCHTVVLHPPSGIAGGDELEIGVQLAADSHALLTTPGAGKWYRSSGAWAAQELRFDLAENAVLEWLPQETIVFNAALAIMRSEIRLAEGACFIGQEILCLGRRAMSEAFERGCIRLGTDIRLGDRLLWHERGHLEGGERIMQSPTGLAGFSVTGTMLVAGREIPGELLASCRGKLPPESNARYGLTALPQLLVARYLGHSSESAKTWFADLWSVLRPALLGREARIPRIWST